MKEKSIMNTQSYKILIIEDDKQIGSLLNSAFEARNHQSKIITNGTDAINFLEEVDKDSFDIILLDIMLPGATGWEILARVRSLKSISDIPIIMLTGIDDDMTESQALYEGADDYVVKPFTTKVLLARIEANIRKRSSSSTMKFDLPYSDGTYDELSERELEILAFIVKGFSNKDIAKKAFISEYTVMNHVTSILKKLKVESRIQAAVVALKYGIIK